MVATVGVGFCADVTAFTELLFVVSGVSWTDFLPIAKVLVITAFGVILRLVAVSWVGGFCFMPFVEYSFSTVDLCFAFASSLRIDTKLHLGTA